MPQVVDSAGNIWETDPSAPSGYRYVGKVGGQAVAPNPIKVRQAQTEIAKTQVDTTGKALDNRVTAATLTPTIQKAVADAITASGEGNIKTKQDTTNAGVIGTAERSKALQQFNGGRALGASIADIQQKFDVGPGATSGIAGLLDYFPTASNSAFNAAGTTVRGPVRNALGLTGSENNSPVEQQMNFQGYIPNSWNYDNVNRDIIERLKRVQNQAAIDAIQKLGGIPDANGNVVPLTEQQKQIFAAFSAAGGNEPDGYKGDLYSALLGNGPTPPPPSGTGGGAPPSGPQGGPTGGPTLGLSRGQNFTSPQDLAIAAAVNKAFSAGADVQGLAKAAQDAGAQLTPNDLAAFQQAVQARRDGRAVTFNPQATGQRTPMQQTIGAALMSPVGTALTTAVSGAGLNALDGILPDQMAALRALNPNAATVGDIGGAIAGTGALNAGARAGLRALPGVGERVLGGGGLAKFGRSLAGDTAYGVAYGQNVNDDPLTGALGGALGSAGGQLVGKGIGSALGGAVQSEAGQALARQIQGLTIGQRMGGTVKRIEDAMTSIPGVGDLINARRGESLTGLNRAAFNEASGGAVDQIGREGLDQFGNVTRQAYDTALAGKSFPIDAQTMSDLQGTQQLAAGLPDDLAKRFNLAMRNRVSPVVNAPPMSGNDYQQAMRGLSGYKAELTKPGFEADYRAALSGAQDALKGAVSRSAAPETLAQLGQADRLYRGQKILEDAINRNRKDAAGIGADMFRPGDLTEAVYQNGKKFGGNAPMQDLARYAQEVIPSKMPDSGTARRLLQANLAAAGLGAGLGGGGGALMGDEDRMSAAGSGAGLGAGTGLGVLALLAAGGTKTGQAALAKALFNRPDSLTRFGRAVGQRKGLFGSAAVPLLLEGQNQ